MSFFSFCLIMIENINENTIVCDGFKFSMSEKNQDGSKRFICLTCRKVTLTLERSN